MQAKASLLLLLLSISFLFNSEGVNGATTMFSGTSLTSGNYLENGPYRFIMQQDCNLVLYKNRRALWASGTVGRDSPCKAYLRINGNLVVITNTNVIAWTSGSGRDIDNYRLIVQLDGNVVIYGGDNQALWATNTVQSQSV